MTGKVNLKKTIVAGTKEKTLSGRPQYYVRT
jgi:hypothetical protein